MGAIDEIRHLVILMLENQSFDRLLGYLDLGDRTQKLEGLTGTETNPVSPPADMTPVPVSRVSAPSAYVTDPGPGHDFEDVNQQLFADRAPADTRPRIPSTATSCRMRGPFPARACAA
jgi:phospholipase C